MSIRHQDCQPAAGTPRLRQEDRALVDFSHCRAFVKAQNRIRLVTGRLEPTASLIRLP